MKRLLHFIFYFMLTVIYMPINPLLSGHNNHIFNPPKRIFMAIKDNSVTSNLIKAERHIPIGYTLIKFTDDDCYLELNKFLKYLKMVQEFKFGVMRSDFCRYLYLYEYGGIYIDSDVVIKDDPIHWISQRPIIEINPHIQINMVIGLEALAEYDNDHFMDPFQSVQWTFAATKKHQIMMDAMDDIYDAYMNNKEDFDNAKHIVRLTGPGALTRSYKKYIEMNSNQKIKLENVPVVVKDVYIGSLSLFNCRQLYCSGYTAVDHLFSGSWK